jgi:hypothetical protein
MLIFGKRDIIVYQNSTGSISAQKPKALQKKMKYELVGFCRSYGRNPTSLHVNSVFRARSWAFTWFYEICSKISLDKRHLK